MEVLQPLPMLDGILWLYEVSNLGRVRRSAPGPNTYVGRILRPVIDKYGYVRVVLTNGPRRKLCQVHRLVLLTFRGPCPEGYQAHHINEDKQDNRLENLEWVTPRQNSCLRPTTKLDSSSVKEIRQIGEKLARKYGISVVTVGNVLSRRSYPKD